MNGFIKGQHISDIIGKSPLMGSLTDEQIREHFKMQARDGFGKQALEELSRTEKKPVEEIRRICGLEEEGVKKQVSNQKFSDEMKAEIWEKSLDGVPIGKIADEYHITPAQVHGILSAVRTKQDKERAERFPMEPKYDEHELEFEKHVEELEAKRDAHKPKPEPVSEEFAVEPVGRKTGVWYALLEQLEEFAVGMFGTGTVFDSGAASSEKKIARLGVLTPDRKRVQITIEELGE